LLSVRWDKSANYPGVNAPDAVTSYEAEFRRIKSASEQSESETTSVPGSLVNRTLSEFNTWADYTVDGSIVNLSLDKVSEFTLSADSNYKKVLVTQITKDIRNCRSMCNVHAALAAHEQYQVRIRSLNAFGHSDWSPWSDTNDGAGSTV
jgi:hypothetical protein